MEILHPKTIEEAVKMMKEGKSKSLFLSGGNDILRLNGEGKENSILLDVAPLLGKKIYKDKESGMVHIGAMATLEDVYESRLVPSILREACLFCPSFERRNTSTIGGNVGAMRSDSYLLSTLSVLDVVLKIVTLDGDEREESVPSYVKNKSKALITEFIFDGNKKGRTKRFSRSSETHAAVIASECEGRYAYSVSSSPFVYGERKDVYDECEFKSDIEGSAEYKKYLCSIVFEN